MDALGIGQVKRAAQGVASEDQVGDSSGHVVNRRHVDLNIQGRKCAKLQKALDGGDRKVVGGAAPGGTVTAHFARSITCDGQPAFLSVQQAAFAHPLGFIIAQVQDLAVLNWVFFKECVLRAHRPDGSGGQMMDRLDAGVKGKANDLVQPQHVSRTQRLVWINEIHVRRTMDNGIHFARQGFVVAVGHPQPGQRDIAIDHVQVRMPVGQPAFIFAPNGKTAHLFFDAFLAVLPALGAHQAIHVGPGCGQNLGDEIGSQKARAARQKNRLDLACRSIAHSARRGDARRQLGFAQQGRHPLPAPFGRTRGRGWPAAILVFGICPAALVDQFPK